MKAMIIDRYGEDVALQETKIDIPEIGEQDLLIRIHAASINPIDFKIRDGKVKMLLSFQMPLILGNDFSGTVEQVGSKVTKFQPGDKVFGRPRKSRIGTFAEYISIHEEDVAIAPSNISLIESASLPLVGLTTWQAFHDVLQLKEGQKILIHAGAGGVGTFAIQLAKTMGAYVATTASNRGYDLVKSLGADEIINYKEQDFEKVLKGYDAVFDTLGGTSLEKSFKVLRPGGKIVSVSAVPNKAFAAENNLGFFKKVIFSIVSSKIAKLERKHNVHYHFLFMKPSGEQLSKIADLVEKEVIVPVIDKVFPFKDAQKAIEYVETGRAKGKVIIKVESPLIAKD
ncbi:NADP-dependent oxidoreductase [Fictibacillus phosphorivorans]|uniref:NADP-dependent oxidoreductase n=1 Tax=Fictibacillus phosphorivorans TaxID=1221500 RepID=UPI0011AAD02B|nr:NADP-dependent oxidoreductase [Fictibacillus phosphorivorans]